MAFIDEIKARAKADKKTIVLPETEDVRTYQAAEAVLRGDCRPDPCRKQGRDRKERSRI